MNKLIQKSLIFLLLLIDLIIVFSVLVNEDLRSMLSPLGAIVLILAILYQAYLIAKQ